MLEHTFIPSFHHHILSCTKGGQHACQPALLVFCVVSVDELHYSTKNKQRSSSSMLSTFSTGENVMMETRDEGVFDHDEEMVS